MIYAVYGLLRTATGSDKLLWFDQSAYRGPTASFVNPNSRSNLLWHGDMPVPSASSPPDPPSDQFSRIGALAARAGLERFIHGMGGRLGLGTRGICIVADSNLAYQVARRCLRDSHRTCRGLGAAGTEGLPRQWPAVWRCLFILVSTAAGVCRVPSLGDGAWPSASLRPNSPRKAALLSSMTPWLSSQIMH